MIWPIVGERLTSMKCKSLIAKLRSLKREILTQILYHMITELFVD